MQVIAITPMIQPLGEVPNGIVLYRRDHAYDPYVVHNYTDHRSFEDGTALSLFQGYYCASLEGALGEFRRRAELSNRVIAEGPSFEEAVRAFENLQTQNREGQ